MKYLLLSLVILAKCLELELCFAQTSRIDSLIQNLASKKTQYIENLINNITIEIDKMGYPENLEKAQKILKISENNAQKEIVCFAYRTIGGIYARRQDFTKALEYKLRAFDFAKKNHLQSELVLNHIDLGLFYEDENRPEKAIQNYLNAIEIANQLNSQSLKSQALINLGNFYYRNKNLSEALNYLKQATLIHPDSISKRAQISSNNTIGIIFNDRKDYNKAQQFFEKAIQLAQNYRDTAWIGIASGNLGGVYEAIGQSEKALKMYQTDLAYSIKFKEWNSATNVLNAIANLYAHQQKYELARQYFDSALNISEKQGLFKPKANIYKNLASFYFKRHDFEKAYDYQQRYELVKDSLYQISKEEIIAKTQAEFNSKLQQKTIESLEREKQQQRNILILGGIALFLISFLLGMVYFSRRKTFQQNQVLKQKNLEIEANRNDLANINQLKDRLFSIISHDFKGPLHALQGFLNVWAMGAFSETETQEVMNDLNKRVIHTSEMLDNLLQWAKTQMNGIEANPESISLLALIHENINLLRPQLEAKKIELQISETDDFQVFCDEEMIKLVIRNLISNAIKFTPIGGKIKIEIIQNSDNQIVTSISDNGIGISLINQNKLFGLHTQSTFGTAKEKGTGLGLLLCKEFVEKNGGKIWFESQEGQGSIFSFSLPKDTSIKDNT